MSGGWGGGERALVILCNDAGKSVQGEGKRREADTGKQEVQKVRGRAELEETRKGRITTRGDEQAKKG